MHKSLPIILRSKTTITTAIPQEMLDTLNEQMKIKDEQIARLMAIIEKK
jgi:hypothetical protein